MLRFIIFVVGFCFSQQIFAGSLNYVLNGKALHENNKSYNEDNWGVGFEYNFDENG